MRQLGAFRAWDVDQEWLLPASVHDFVPAGHPAHLTRDVVREMLDLGEIMAAYDEPAAIHQQRRRSGRAAAVARCHRDRLGRSPQQVSADVGYCSEANLQTLAARGIQGYVAPGRQKHPATAEAQRHGPLVEAMRTRLRRAGRRTCGPITEARISHRG